MGTIFFPVLFTILSKFIRKLFGEKWPLDIGSALYRDILFILLTNRGYMSSTFSYRTWLQVATGHWKGSWRTCSKRTTIKRHKTNEDGSVWRSIVVKNFDVTTNYRCFMIIFLQIFTKTSHASPSGWGMGVLFEYCLCKDKNMSLKS